MRLIRRIRKFSTAVSLFITVSLQAAESRSGESLSGGKFSFVFSSRISEASIVRGVPQPALSSTSVGKTAKGMVRGALQGRQVTGSIIRTLAWCRMESVLLWLVLPHDGRLQFLFSSSKPLAKSFSSGCASRAKDGPA